jgi:hypothetical protein
MTTEQLLRDTFERRVADVHDGEIVGRARRAMTEARRVRTRQRVTGVAVGTLAAVVTGLATLAVNPFGDAGDDIEPMPAPQVDVRPSFAGRTLIDSAETSGGAALALSVTAPQGSQWMLTCRGVGPEFVVHVEVEGAPERSAPCGVDDELGETAGFRYTAAEPAGPDRSLRMWVTEADGTSPVTPSRAVLVAAVYALPEAVVTVAGSDVLPVEEVLGEDWAYLAHAVGEPGAREVTLESDQDAETLLELIGAGPEGVRVRLFIDGESAETDPAAYPLNGVAMGDLVPAGRHTVTLRVVGDVPADALLAIVQRSPAG